MCSRSIALSSVSLTPCSAAYKLTYGVSDFFKTGIIKSKVKISLNPHPSPWSLFFCIQRYVNCKILKKVNRASLLLNCVLWDFYRGFGTSYSVIFAVLTFPHYDHWEIASNEGWKNHQCFGWKPVLSTMFLLHKIFLVMFNCHFLE